MNSGRRTSLVAIFLLVTMVLAAMVCGSCREREGCNLRKATPLPTPTPMPTPTLSPMDAIDPCLVADVTFLAEGARPDWHGDLIAFDKRTDGIFEIYTMKSDGTDVKCLTCNKPGAPPGHRGNPAFSPDGRFIAFTGENENGTHDLSEEPGKGGNNDLWIMTSDGNNYYRMTSVPKDNGGTLHPHFSHDGTKLTWTEMYEASKITPAKVFGSWKLKIADFSVAGGVPTLSNIKEYIPGDDVFYENHGLSPDGSTWLFSSNFRRGVSVSNLNIYTMNLGSGRITQLTTSDYNEHAQYSPDGNKMVWMHGPGGGTYESDLWLMDSDSTDKLRLTSFNDPTSPDYAGGPVLVGDNSWNGEGSRVVFVLISGTKEKQQQHNLYILDFEGSCG